MLKKLIARVTAKSMQEADLNRESAIAATDYLKKNGAGLTMIQTQDMANQVAHGFYMGFRAAEEKAGLR